MQAPRGAEREAGPFRRGRPRVGRDRSTPSLATAEEWQPWIRTRRNRSQPWTLRCVRCKSRSVALADEQMEIVSNCEPWTVRRLASHALNNQLFWGGVVTGEETVSFEDTMGAVPYDGDLAQFAGEVTGRALANVGHRRRAGLESTSPRSASCRGRW